MSPFPSELNLLVCENYLSLSIYLSISHASCCPLVLECDEVNTPFGPSCPSGVTCDKRKNNDTLKYYLCYLCAR